MSTQTKPYIDDNQPTELCRHNQHPERCIYKGCGYRLALEENARLKAPTPAAHAGKLHIDPEAPRDIRDEKEEIVAYTLKPDVPGAYDAVALARQFAASGEVLDALKNLLALVEGEAPSLLEDDHHYGMVADAIEKAEGK